MKESKVKQKEIYDRNARNELSPLRKGEKVWVKLQQDKKWIEGEIVEKLPRGE